VVQCNAAGNAWASPTNCPASKPCRAYGGAAACGGVPTGIDGGTTPGGIDGGSGIDGSIQGCSTSTADPCKAGMPKFSGNQTVDGKGDDMCSLPAFLMGPQNNAKINNYNSVPLTQLETATVQVGWSANAFHLFIDVQDSSVQTVNMADPTQAINKSYQGDSIEIFISSNNTLTGLTSSDNSALHVIIPANGPAVSVKTDKNGGGTPTELPKAQYGQSATATGYAIEAQLPWQGGNPNAGGTIRFDLAINSADKTFGGVDDMRDAQIIYFIGTPGGATTCPSGGDGTVPYCDDRTWCPSQVQ
jgi:Carbohydrate family 9 binding domain-like